METYRGPMLLVIERDRKFTAKLKAHLNVPGMRTFFVESGQDAFYLLKSMQAQFILADLNAFESNEALMQLWRYSQKNHVPMLLILGYKRTRIPEETIAHMEGLATIRLPFGLKDLHTRIAGLRKAQDPLIGQLLGPAGQEVKITRKLGAGAMGTVYQGYQPSLERVVAVKFLMHKQQTIDPESAARFTAEAKAMAQMRSPHIVQIYFVGQHEARPYMVMEYIDGPNLETYLRAKRCLPPREALSLAQQILRGLHHAHQRDKIHRDLKPANIMITKEGQAVILDFGLVRNSGPSNITAAGTVLGTPRYMAPEQIADQNLDHRCDLYALGIILYEMTLGQAPFAGKDFATLVTQHLQAPLPRPEEIGRSLDPALFRLIETLAAKKPSDRYPDAATALTSLSNYLANESEQATAQIDSQDAGPDSAIEPVGGLAINESGTVISHFGAVSADRAQSLHLIKSLLLQLEEMEDLGAFERGLLDLEETKMVIFKAFDGLAGVESDRDDVSTAFTRMPLPNLTQLFRKGQAP